MKKIYNNPFNIVRSPSNNWLGEIKHDGRFCHFDTVEHGIRAGIILLRNYVNNGYDTIERIISRYAPPNENYTIGYIHFVCDKLDINMVDKISYPSQTFVNMCRAILQFESAKNYSSNYLFNIIQKYQL